MHPKTGPTRSKSGASPAPWPSSDHGCTGDAVIQPRRRHSGKGSAPSTLFLLCDAQLTGKGWAGCPQRCTSSRRPARR